MKQFFQRIAKRVALIVFVIVLIITNIVTGVLLAIKFGELNSTNNLIKDQNDKIQELQEDVKTLNERLEKQTQILNPNDTANWKVYKSDKLKVSLKYPSNLAPIEGNLDGEPTLYTLNLKDKDSLSFDYPRAKDLIVFWNNLEGRDSLENSIFTDIPNLDDITINGKTYKFKYFGNGDGADCGGGGEMYAFIELRKDLFVSIYNSVSILTCDKDGKKLPESQWIETKYPSKELIDTAKLILQTITLL